MNLLVDELLLVLLISVVVIPVHRVAPQLDSMLPSEVLADLKALLDGSQPLFSKLLLSLNHPPLAPHELLLILLCHILLIGDALIDVVPPLVLVNGLHFSLDKVESRLRRLLGLQAGFLFLQFAPDRLRERCDHLRVQQLDLLVGQLLLGHEAVVYKDLLDFLHSVS